MSRPVILAVDDDAASRDLIEQELNARYGNQYRVVSAQSARMALDVLGGLRTEGADVVVVLADQLMADMNGVELLAAAHRLHPAAKRALLIAWGDRPTAEAVLRATALGQIDNSVVKPFAASDERFHRLVTEFLDAWQQDRGPRFEALQIVAEPWSARAVELRGVLHRSDIPFAFLDVGSTQGRELLRRAGIEGPLPAVVFYDGRVLTDPGIADIAEAFGVDTPLDGHDFDVIIVGAGPAGLSAAVYGASEGLRVLVIDRETIGGQAGSSSLIRNYLGFPRGVSGSDLASRAYEQACYSERTFISVSRPQACRPSRRGGW